MTDPRSELENPGTSAQRLFEIAQANPELGELISAHPNAYPELKQWVAQYAAPAVSVDTDPTAQPAAAQAAQAAQSEPAQAEDPQADAPQAEDPQPQQSAPVQFGQPQAPQQFGAQAPQGGPQPYGAPQATAQQPAAPQQFTAEQPTVPQPTTPQPYAAQQPGMPQYAQPTTPLPQGGYPGGPGGPIPPTGMAMAAGQQPPRKSRKKVWIISIAAALVVALAGAGAFIWMNLANKIDGSPTPEAAATKVLEGIASFDPLTLYGSFAPSEIGAFKAPLEEWLDVKPTDDQKSIQEKIDKLKNAIDIKVEGVEVEKEQLAEGVERVRYVAGTITVDGDKDEIIAAIMDIYRAGDEVSMGSSESYLDSIEDELRDSITLPQTLDFADFNDENTYGFVPSVVTVEEGGKWYISPLLTGADLAYQTASSFGARPNALGTSIIEGKPSATAADAAAALTDAVFNGEIEDVIARLPLAERRLLSIYGPAVELPRGWNDEIELDAYEFSAEAGEVNARVNIEDLSILSRYYSSAAGRDLETTVKFYDHCIEVTSEFYNRSSREVREDTDGGCLVDLLKPLAYEELGVDHFRLIAVPEDGGWYLSPLSTVADMTAIFISHIKVLAEEGRLEEVFNSIGASSPS